MRRVAVPPSGIEFIVVIGSSLEPTDEELESLRGILVYVVPLSLIVAGIGGWFLARRSLSPVVAMADRARRIGVENLGERLPVANPRDELGLLAETFNELLGRLEASLVQQRQFMADASHEGFKGLPSPLTVTRYHSLIVRDEGLPGALAVTARSPEGEIMGLAHRSHPVHGVQFHPEAVLTEHGLALLRNFLAL